MKKLIAIRKSHDALINGGIRWIYAHENAFAYLRESRTQTLLIFASRQGGNHTINLAPFGYRIEKTLYGKDQKGGKVTINSRTATSGIWLLT